MARKRKNRGKKKGHRPSTVYKPPKQKKCGLTSHELIELCSNIHLTTNNATVLTYGYV